jgi:AcrR family transcriptional regulator
MKMAFSKGKRIEDETSMRIIELATNIGCREGANALTVTRLCRELNCDRRVIYNRFRDIDEINMLVATRCNEELVTHAKNVVNPTDSYYEKLVSFIKAAFTYIYEKNSNFQYYTSLYSINDGGVKNEILQELTSYIDEGKSDGYVDCQADSSEAAQNIWLIATGVSGMLATNDNYKYNDGLKTMLYGVEAITAYVRPAN